VGHVEKDSPAEKAGLRVGDCILAVDGKKVTKFSGMGSSIMWRVVRSEGATVPVRFERDGQTMEVEVTPVIDKTKPWERKSLRRIGIEAAATPIIGAIATNSPAQRANLRRGDEILEVDGQRLVHPSQLGAFIDAHRDASLKLTVHREGKSLQVSVKPEIPVDADDGKPRLGILWDDSGGRMTLSHPAVFQQITDSVDALVSTIGALISPKSDIKPQHLSGPAKIVNIYYILFQSDQGWRLALWFSVLLNVNLALLNMLPIPVLDGGHIVLSTIEGLRRKPANPRIVGWVQTACAVLLIGYMLYVTFFDLQDSRWRLKEKPSIDMKFTPKQGTPAAPNAPAPTQ
jgi:regulator of sigma E protease